MRFECRKTEGGANQVERLKAILKITNYSLQFILSLFSSLTDEKKNNNNKPEALKCIIRLGICKKKKNLFLTLFSLSEFLIKNLR